LLKVCSSVAELRKT